MFVDHSSAAEVGTTRASINRTGKTNAAKGVENHYNEYSEFHAREIEAHICASFMEMTGMKTTDGKNNQRTLIFTAYVTTLSLGHLFKTNSGCWCFKGKFFS